MLKFIYTDKPAAATIKSELSKLSVVYDDKIGFL